MKRLEVNPGNEKYYTKEFISGYRCGTKRQFESDLTILDKIRAEVMSLTDGCTPELIRNVDVLEIIDKYKAEREGIKALEQEPKTGHWIEHQEGRWIYAKCSNCGTVHDTQTNYCPTCGFAMERTDI